MARKGMGRKKKPPMSYTPAPAVEEIAQTLIAQYHRHLLENDVRIEYCFCTETPKSKGRARWGQARKETSLAAFYGRTSDEETLKAFFAIVISKPAWDYLTPEQRAALVDHELCHLLTKVDGEGNVQLSIKPHDLEEFGEVVMRHGLWAPDVKKFAKAIAEGPQTTMELAESR